VVGSWLRGGSCARRLLQGVARSLSAAHERWTTATVAASVTARHGRHQSSVPRLQSHEPLEQAIARKEGLHATFKEACLKCHPEHKGRTAAIDKWDLLGGRRAFDHKRTGFVLTAKHGEVPCTPATSALWRRPDFLHRALTHVCRLPQEPARFHRRRDRGSQVRAVPSARALAAHAGRGRAFNHAQQAHLALTGEHAKILCVACHKKGKMTTDGSPRSCKDCHKTPHGPTFSDKPCARCHVPEKPGRRRLQPRHHRVPLRGEHQSTECSRCHKDPRSSRRRPACRVTPTSTRVGSRSGYARTATPGRLAQNGVRPRQADQVQAHRTTRRDPLPGLSPGRQAERVREVSHDLCQDCHRHQNAHKGQFKDKLCTACHAKV